MVDVGLTLLAQAKMPLKYWWDAFEASVYLINRLPSSTIEYMFPFLKLYNTAPNYKFLKVFGCACFLHMRPYNSFKLQFRSTKCIFLGYSAHHKGYKCLHPSGRVYIADSVDFNECEFPYHTLFPSKTDRSSSASPISSPFIFTRPTYSIPTNAAPTTTESSLSLSSSSSSSDIISSPPHTLISSQPTNTHTMITRAKAGITKPIILILTTTPPSLITTTQKTALPIAPKSYKSALNDVAWFQTMEAENSALKEKGTWILVSPDPSQKLITNKWVFRVKTKADGTLDKLKARLVFEALNN